MNFEHDKYCEALEKSIEKNIRGKNKDRLLLGLKSNSISHPTKPKKVNLENVRSVTETAFQRAIFNNGTSLLYLSDRTVEVKWLDLELPVILSKNPRRKCVDLIGVLEGAPFICELKYYNSNGRPGDSPEYGIYELLIYYYHVKKNGELLKLQQVYHVNQQNVRRTFDWQDISNKLIFTANKKYWDYFRGDKLDSFISDLSSLISVHSVQLYLFETADNDFKNQLRNSRKLYKGKTVYKPAMSDNNWQLFSSTRP